MPGEPYVLGSHAEELARLDHQASAIERPTRLLMQAAGLAAGMRVLDLGTGLGHVARLAAAIVGPSGRVVGIDQSEEALTIARERTAAAGTTHVEYIRGNAAEWRASEPFDAIVTRLFLFHVANPTTVVRHHLANLRPRGLFLAVDYDIGSARTEPSVPLLESALHWIEAGFRSAGAWPRIGARLGGILSDAGLGSVTTLGIQGYIAPDDPAGPKLVAGVVRSLAPTLVSRGIATEAELGLSTLEERIASAVRLARAVLLPPTVVGAWGHTS